MNRNMNGGDLGPPGGAAQAASLEDKLRAFYVQHVPPGAPRPEPRMVIEHFSSPQTLNDALLKKYGASLDLDDVYKSSENGTGHGLGSPDVIQGAGQRRSGWIYKKGGLNPTYAKRFFVFEKGQLAWYKEEISEDDPKWGVGDQAKGTISCVAVAIEPNTGEENGLYKFALNPIEGTTVRRIQLACVSANDRDAWVGAFRRYGCQQESDA
jgi:hypothetical protein